MAGENEAVQEQPVVSDAPAVVEQQTPVVADAPAADAPAVEQQADAPQPETSKPATVAETPSLIEEAAASDDKPQEGEKAEGEKPAEEAKGAEEKPAEEKPVEEKAAEKPADDPDAAKTEQPKEAAPEPPPPVEYKFELPENVALPDERRAELFGVLDSFRADPSNMQPLVDFHVAEVNRVIEQAAQQQHDVFNNTRKAWRDEIKADPDMGGSGFQTTVRGVTRARNELVSDYPVGTPEYDRQSKEADEFFRITGAGDHPVMWRILKNAARFLAEAKPLDADVAPAPNGRPTGSRRSLIYNHPTSPNNKGVS